MLDDRFVFLGAAIGLTGSFLYARNTFRGDNQPNRMTFLLWALAPILAFVVQIRIGVGLVSVMTLSIGLGPLIVLGATYTGARASWQLGWFDYTCGALSLLGLAAWVFLQQGVVAVLLFVAADGLAALPTVAKAWRAPQSESVSFYSAAFINASIALGTIDEFNVAAAAFPVYAFTLTALLMFLIRLRPGGGRSPAYSC